MRLFTSIFCTLFLALSAFGQAIDYRALRTNQFSTNVPSRGYVGIIGYGVTNIPGTNVQFNSGTGITFTTNGAAITITATGTNQTLVTNVVVRAGDNVTVTTNGPTDWTINALDLWATNAPDGSITNINTISGTAYVSGTNGLLVLDNATSGKTVLLTGETNGTPSYRLRSDGSAFIGRNVTQDVAIATFTTVYPFYQWSLLNSNDAANSSIVMGGSDQEGKAYAALFNTITFANKDASRTRATWQIVNTNSHTRTFSFDIKETNGKIELLSNGVTVFYVDVNDGNLSAVRGVLYNWPHTNGAANQFLTTDGGTPQQLSWGSAITGVAAGTNITVVTNGPLVTISVANTNLPVVVAGSNITVATNGIAYTVSGAGGASVVVAGTNVTVVTNGSAYTVSSTAVGGGGGAVGPGTINQVAKFVATTNVGDSIVSELATNMWQWKSRTVSYTNHITNEFVGEWTNPTNWVALDLVSAGPASEFAELHAVQGSSHTTGMWPLHLMDTWSFESLSPVAGHTAGELFPVVTDTYIIGDNSHLVNNISIGTGGIDVGIAATKPALRFHNLFTSTWFGVDGTGSSLAFYRDTGITAAFDKPNGNLCFDVAGNYIGFGVGISNCTAFLSTGEAVTNGLVQIGTNSAVASPVPAGIMSSRGSGSDKGAADLVVAGGVSTGTGTSGKILFATSGSAAGSSSTLNGLTNRMEIDPGTGNVTIYSNLTVNGSFSAGSISDPNALTNNDTRNITFNGTFTDTQNGVSTVIASNTITSGMITLSGSGTNYFGANVNVNGTVNATGYTNSSLTPGKPITTGANNQQRDATFSDINSLAQGNIVTNQSSTLTFTNVTLYGSSGGTNWTFTDAAGWHNTNSGAASQGVDISKGDIYATKTITATNGFSSRSNVFTLMPTNTPTDGQVMTATGTAGDTAWKTTAGGSFDPFSYISKYEIFYEPFGCGARTGQGTSGALGWWTSTVGSSSVTTINGVAGHYGISELVTGTAAADTAAITWGDASSTSIMPLPPLNNVTGWTNVFIWRLSVTNDAKIYVGLLSTAWNSTTTQGADPINFMGLKYDGTNSTRFQHICTASSSPTVTNDIVAVANTWHTNMIWSTVSGTISFNLDGGAQADISSNVPTGSTTPFFCVVKTASANATHLDCDLYLGIFPR